VRTETPLSSNRTEDKAGDREDPDRRVWRPIIAVSGLAVFAVAFGVTVWAKTPEIAQSFPILVGAIVSLVSTISGYYFGSSVGSQNKDGIIKAALETAQGKGPGPASVLPHEMPGPGSPLVAPAE
jgi:hypothetical protein